MERLVVLAVGASGSIGREVVAEAIRQGHTVRALLRDPRKSRELPRAIEVVIGDVTKPDTLIPAMRGVDAVVFTLGSDGLGSAAAEAIDYGGVRNVLATLKGRQVRIALMTAIGVTDRRGAHDWKRRAERLVRASGSPYTIVRPGWFDYNAADQHRLTFLQGDTRHAGDPSDGVVSRRQIAQVLVASLVSEVARRKTFELVAERGAAQQDLEPLFAELVEDAIDSVDGARDPANLALEDEPPGVRQDLQSFLESR